MSGYEFFARNEFMEKVKANRKISMSLFNILKDDNRKMSNELCQIIDIMPNSSYGSGARKYTRDGSDLWDGKFGRSK